MSNQCFNFMKDVPDKILNGDSARKVFEDIASTINKDDPNIEETIKRLQDDLLNEYNIEDFKKQQWIDAVAKQNWLQKVKEGDDPKQAVIGSISGVFGKFKGRRQSVDAQQTGMVDLTLGSLVDELKKNDTLDFFVKSRNTDDEIDIANELKGVDTGNAQAKKTAETINGFFDKNRNLLNKYGAKIKELHDFISGQSHDAEKMIKPTDSFKDYIKTRFQLIDAARKAGMSIKDAYQDATKKLYVMARERWKQYILPRLDQERTFRNIVGNSVEKLTPEKMDNILNHVFDVITKGKASKIYKENANLADKVSKNRVLHFKDGNGWVDYCRQYGKGNLADSIIHTLESESKSYINLKNFGIHADQNFQWLKQEVINAHKDDPNIVAKLNHADKYFKTVMGYDTLPHSYLGAKISASLRAMQNLTKLSLVVLISLSDHAQAISALRSHGMNIFDRYGALLKSYFDPMERQIRKEVADCLGITAKHTLGMYNNRFASADSPAATLARLQNIFFKLNGQIHFDNALRGGFASAIARNLALNIDKKFDNLDPSLKHTLGGYGYDEDFHNFIRDNKDSMKAINGQHFVTPDMFYTATDDSIKKYLGTDSLTDAQRKQVIQDSQEKLATFFSDQTNLAQMQMGAAERAMLYRGTQPGTVAGELLRFIGQFKFYGLGVTRRAIGRIWKESDGPLDVTRGLTDYMMAALLWGTVSNASQQLVKTGSLPNPSSFQTYSNALIEGGGAGLLGGFLMGRYQDYGTSLTKTAVGPVAGEADDLAKLLFTLGDFTGGGKRTSYYQKSSKALMQFGNSHIWPGMMITKNIITKSLYDHVMNAIDPTYINSQKKQLKDQQDSNIQLWPFG